MAVIDWHLSLVDSGRAECWPTRSESGRLITTVPWVVAAAIDALRGHAISASCVQDVEPLEVSSRCP
jgi:hypothetical protein